MPEMDGFETAAMIRSRRQTAQTPIIFITAFSDEMHTAQGYSLGAVDYILSPVVPEILRTKVGVFVELYKKTQQVKRQAEERVALAREQAARAAAEEATRRSAFLAEASTVLGRRSTTRRSRGAGRPGRPLPGRLLRRRPGRGRGPPAAHRAGLGRAGRRHDRRQVVEGLGPRSGPLWEPIRRVAEGGEWEICRLGTSAGDPAGDGRGEATATAPP